MRYIVSGSKEGRAQMVNEARQLKTQGLGYHLIAKKLGYKRHQSIVQMLQVKVSNSGNCAKCNRRGEHLHRHHKDYLSNEIELLCAVCHRLEHIEKSTKFRADQLAEFINRSATMKEIKVKTGLKRTTIMRWAKRFNITLIHGRQGGLFRNERIARGMKVKA